jgi:maltooligosyltrehalose synthase
VVGFARSFAGKTVIALAGRFFLRLFNGHPTPTGDVWGNTALILPKKIRQPRFQDALTGRDIAIEQREDGAVISLSQAFSHCPAALLVSQETD